MPNISSTRVTTGTERVRSGGRCGTNQTSSTNANHSSTTFTPKNARHDHTSASTDATSGPHAPPMPPSAPQMPTASGCEPEPSNSASMAASDVVKQHADAMPCSERPSIITPKVSLQAQVADAIAKPTTPISSTGRAPTRSAMRPMSSSGAGERQAGGGDDRAGDLGGDVEILADRRQQHDDAVHVDRRARPPGGSARTAPTNGGSSGSRCVARRRAGRARRPRATAQHASSAPRVPCVDHHVPRSSS